MQDIRKIRYAGHTLYEVDGEIASAKYALHRLRVQGYRTQQAAQLMADMRPTLAEPRVPLVALTHRGRVLGYQASTWIGERCATFAAMTKWLRREGYSAVEIDSLYTLARREIVTHLDDVRRMISFGLRA